MKFLKNNLKVIIAFILGTILTGGIVYAAVSASQVTYTTDENDEISTVAEALDDLYSIKNSKINETLFWFYYYDYAGRGMILKEDGTVVQSGGTLTGNKIRSAMNWGSNISIYAVQTGRFRVTMTTADSGLNTTPTTEIKTVNAGELICSGSSITCGIVEALF